MAADFTYGTYAVYDPTTNSEVDNGTGGKFVLVLNGPAQPIYDLNGTPIAEITSNALGQSSQFRADSPNGLIQFGSTAVTVFANEVGTMAVTAFNATAGLSSIPALQSQVNTIQAQVNQLATGGNVSVSVATNNITDSTAVGRAVLTAAAAVDARTAIGAGTYTAPSVIAAGTTQALARTAIGFDPAVRAGVPYGRMLWNTTTSTWWAYDPTTNAYVNGGPRPACPQGACTYDARNDAAATLPTGTQAPLPVSPNGMVGDEFKLHQSSSLIP
jgi:hypothetical protein